MIATKNEHWNKINLYPKNNFMKTLIIFEEDNGNVDALEFGEVISNEEREYYKILRETVKRSVKLTISDDVSESIDNMSIDEMESLFKSALKRKKYAR